MGYDELDADGQVDALRPAAVEAAASFGLDVLRLEVVAHEFNTTFAVDTAAGERLALRVHTNSVSTPENVRAQLAWQRAVADQTDVVVPRPRATPAGEWFTWVDGAGYGVPLLVTVASWLEGPDVGDPDSAVARALGRSMALLHAHAAAWAPPAGARLSRFDTPLFGDPDLLGGAPGLDGEERDVLERAMARCDLAFARLLRDGAPLRPLHADLHGGNLKWHDGQLGVFDFDDCGLGVPALDLAITAFYVREPTGAIEQAVRDGYRQVAPLPDVDVDDLEALIAARQLLLANSLLTITTADLRAQAPEYLLTTVARLRRWLDTGRFTRHPA